MRNSVARRYFRQVKWRLVCPRPDRERLEAQVRTMVLGFAEEYPEAKYEQYIANFGAPQFFADTILGDVDQGQVQKAKQWHKRICWLAAAGLVVVLALSAVFWYIQYENARDLSKNEDVTFIDLGTYQGELTEEEIQSILNGTWNIDVFLEREN